MILDWAGHWRATWSSCGSTFFWVEIASKDGLIESVDWQATFSSWGSTFSLAEFASGDDLIEGIDWRATFSSWGSASSLTEIVSENGLKERVDCFTRVMEVGLGVLFSDSFSFGFSWTLTKVDSISTLPPSALWGELSKFSWGSMIWWCIFCATSVFVSGQSILLKISWTLGNTSTGMPSFSSKPGKSIAPIGVLESISEKRTCIQTKNN